MKYYQDSAGKVHGINDADPTQAADLAAAVSAGWTDITASWPPAETAAQIIQGQIAALEASVTPRMAREAISASTNVFPSGSHFAGLTSAQALTQIETQIVALRAQLPTG